MDPLGERASVSGAFRARSLCGLSLSFPDGPRFASFFGRGRRRPLMTFLRALGRVGNVGRLGRAHAAAVQLGHVEVVDRGLGVGQVFPAPPSGRPLPWSMHATLMSAFRRPGVPQRGSMPLSALPPRAKTTPSVFRFMTIVKYF
jgi:hypothetical protein